MSKSKRILTLFLILALFFSFHLSMYQLFTRRLSNNFSSAAKAGMIDVENYLPHRESSLLPTVLTSLELSEPLPVLDGAAALVPVYGAIIHNLYPEGCVTFIGGEFSDDNFYGENFAPDSAMQYKNTVRGYQAIVDGTTDLLFCAAPSAEQMKYAEEKGVELVFVPIGLEAFVFFVNENNPVENLTADQIRKIYAGKYTNWSQLGGANRIINPITRLEGSGSQSAFERFMGDEKIGRKSFFAVTGASIGFSFRYYMTGIVQNSSVKMISVNGVSPTPENVRNRSYPLVSEFYAIYRKDNPNENLPRLVHWLLSDEGQNLIEACGYVRLGETKTP